MSREQARAGRRPTSGKGHARFAALVDAAAAVLADRGYEATTMTAIAERAGASIGSLYQYFPTKEDVAGHLHAAYLDRLETALSDLSGVPLKALAGAVMDALASFLESHPAFATLANRRDIDPARKLASRSALEERLTKLLSDTGSLPSSQCAAMAVLLLQQIKLVVTLQASGRPEDFAAIAHVRRMLERHLRDLTE